MDIVEKLKAHAMGPHMHPELQDDILEAIKEMGRMREVARNIREICAEIAEGWCSPHGSPRDLEVAQAIALSIREYGPPNSKAV